MTDAAVVLGTLRDVPGVQGSFLLSEAGALCGRDMPAVFSDETLAEAGPRLCRLADAFSDAGPPVQTCVLRCGDFTLFVRVVGAGALCVLASDGVSMPALRMAANLAARRLGTSATGSPLPPPPPPAPPPVPAVASPPAATPSAGAARPAVQWRGSTLRNGR